jgi:hypothetical protein
MMPKYEILFDEYEDEDVAKIRLTEERFNGIVYNYRTVHIEGQGEEAVLKYEYDIGDVLVNIIGEKINENGADDSNESNLRGKLHSASSAIPEG